MPVIHMQHAFTMTVFYLSRSRIHKTMQTGPTLFFVSASICFSKSSCWTKI